MELKKKVFLFSFLMLLLINIHCYYFGYCFKQGVSVTTLLPGPDRDDVQTERNSTRLWGGMPSGCRMVQWKATLIVSHQCSFSHPGPTELLPTQVCKPFGLECRGCVLPSSLLCDVSLVAASGEDSFLVRTLSPKSGNIKAQQ